MAADLLRPGGLPLDDFCRHAMPPSHLKSRSKSTPNSRSRSKNTSCTPNPNQSPRLRRSRRRHGDSKDSKSSVAKSPVANLVMGQVTILKRGEKPDVDDLVSVLDVKRMDGDSSVGADDGVEDLLHVNVEQKADLVHEKEEHETDLDHVHVVEETSVVSEQKAVRLVRVQAVEAADLVHLQPGKAEKDMVYVDEVAVDLVHVEEEEVVDAVHLLLEMEKPDPVHVLPEKEETNLVYVQAKEAADLVHFQPDKEEADVFLCSTMRLGPDPNILKDHVCVSESQQIDLKFAGAAHVVSPPPSSLPVPVFFSGNEKFATLDLLRMLRLNLL